MGRTIEVNSLLEKAELSIDVILLGISIDGNLEYEKAFLPIDVTSLGIMVFSHPRMSFPVDVSIMALQSFLES